MRYAFILALVMLAGISAAWANDANKEMMDARYDYVACDVDYAEEWLAMREGCGEENGVEVFDSSSYVDDLNDDLEDLAEARDENRPFEFGLGMVQMAADSLRLVGRVVQDAFDHKNGPFFSCVRDGETPLMDDRDQCRDRAMEKAREASRHYVQNELEYAEGQIDDMDALGADTSGMERVAGDGEELLDDLDPAFDSGDPQELRKLHMRNFRLVLLFRAEKMLATIDYARPIIEDSQNGNKEEVLDRMDSLQEDVEDYLDACAYSESVGNPNEYSRENLECWDGGIDLFQEFNSIRALIIGGAFS
ncbi:MAG: hypothetical protein AB1295_04640 [Candidatus Micrarchaeota archaeon]